MGDSFLHDRKVLVTLDTKLVMDSSADKTLTTVEDIGQTQYATFVQERIVLGQKPLTDTMLKNKFVLFRTT